MAGTEAFQFRAVFIGFHQRNRIRLPFDFSAPLFNRKAHGDPGIVTIEQEGFTRCQLLATWQERICTVERQRIQ
ncbi:hypothetical protein D3C76_1837190 [compost metagenome]